MKNRMIIGTVVMTLAVTMIFQWKLPPNPNWSTSAFSPRGTFSPSRKRAIASKRYAPISVSGIEAIEGSVTVVRLKMASASRCREGEDGAVNWKTAGPVRATL